MSWAACASAWPTCAAWWNSPDHERRPSAAGRAVRHGVRPDRLRCRLCGVRRDPAGPAPLGRLYRLGPETARKLITPLLRPRAGDPASADAAYHAALLCCAWGDAAGERILAAAVDRRDPPPSGGRQVSRSWAAAWALGCGGTPRAWRVLADYAADAANPVPARLTAAFSCARIAQRHAPRPADRARLARLLPAIEGCQQKLRPWQAALVAEQVRLAFDLPRDPSALKSCSDNPSLIVRRAFRALQPGTKNRQSASG